MAAEIQYRHTATGSTMRATVRKEQTVGGKAQMWNGSAWEDMTVANWANYVITLTETPASSYVYIGNMPAVAAGWYYVDVYSGTAISSTLEATLFGYWDGTVLALGGADARQVGGTAQTAGDILGVWTTTKAGYVDVAISSRGTSTLTQTQVSGGTYDLTNATFVAAFKSALGTVPASGDWATVGAAMTLANGSIVTATFGTCVPPAPSGMSTLTTADIDARLAAINLDHIAGTATDIPAVPAGTYIDQLMDDGTATYDRTTDSLQAVRDRGDAAWVTGSGGDATAANQTTIINHLTGMKGAGWTDESLKAIKDAVDAIDVGSGSGVYACTWTVNDGATALQGATVSFWLNGVLKGTGTTGVAGTVAMSLDAGTYTVAISLSGYTFASTTHAVSATASTWTKTFSMSLVTITASTSGFVTGYFTAYNTAGAVASGLTCTLDVVRGPQTKGSGVSFPTTSRSATSAANGLVQFTGIPWGAEVLYERGNGKKTRATAPTSGSTWAMDEVVGTP